MFFLKLFNFSICVLFILNDLTECSIDWKEDEQPEKWHDYAKDKLDVYLKRTLNGNVAKNIVFFLGDGMGISTVTAGRIRKGQMQGRNGEEEVTHMESLSHVALAKTYNIDAQTADSAGTATAFLSGVKTRFGHIGLDGRAFDCASAKQSKIETILKWAHYAGKSTGIVTTARVTHATPAAAYAHTHMRDSEAYDDVNFKKEHFEQGCRDIASQLVDDFNYINLVIGGGRRKFMRKTDHDYVENKFGDRTDNRNLIHDWDVKMKHKNKKHKFVWNRSDFESLKPSQFDQVLALLSYDHMLFETERVINQTEPSLTEMTQKAIELLSTNPNGYFLLIEGGKIDHGHHGSNARRALDEFVVLDEAIGKAKQMVSLNETLFIVTADHSHVFTIGGFAVRGQNLFDLVESKEIKLSKFGFNYTPLLYGNGDGYVANRTYNLSSTQTNDVNYKQESAVPLKYETHGGEDVAIYASGPMSFLLDGTVEQNYIAHVMAYSACIGPYNATYVSDCRTNRGVLVNSVSRSKMKKLKSLIALLIIFSFHF